ncbi:LysR substrate-binding domain-containing protein [Brevundimonas subvibrioides]|uniref:LysR substrate-binding domain-containing protein n=1 Tax=Brevundimonas subvibrioides TaxID=74313 RepID=UPI0022B50591|nr:LysR substrate-binding domain-containing protein [Brevundimonas subvibrioides]
MGGRFKNLDVDLLRTFVVVVETGSFTRSAALLGRSQPAISLQIRRLEEQMAATLLDRSGKRSAPTMEGAALLRQARKLLRLNDEIVAGTCDGGVEGQVRFGAPEDIATTHLSGILGSFGCSYPRIRLTVTCDYTPNLLDQMSRGMLDLALVKRAFMGADEGVRVWREPLVWVAADPSLQEISPLPLIVAPAPDIYRRRAIEALDAAGLSYRASFTSPGLSGQLAALRGGLGIGVLPAATAPPDLPRLHGHLPPLSDSEMALVSRKGGDGPSELLAREVLLALQRWPSRD